MGRYDHIRAVLTVMRLLRGGTVRDVPLTEKLLENSGDRMGFKTANYINGNSSLIQHAFLNDPQDFIETIILTNCIQNRTINATSKVFFKVFQAFGQVTYFLTTHNSVLNLDKSHSDNFHENWTKM